jgi:hypothetical protein
VGTLTDVADILAMSDGRRLVGNRAQRQATAAYQRHCRRRRENGFSHEHPPSPLERCYRAGVETQPGSEVVVDRVGPCCPTATRREEVRRRSSFPFQTVPRKPHARNCKGPELDFPIHEED